MYGESRGKEKRKTKKKWRENQLRKIRGKKGEESRIKGKKKEKEGVGLRSGIFHHLQGRPLNSALEYSVRCYLLGKI